jgi:hypothetical protein
VDDLEQRADQEVRELARGRRWSTPFRTLSLVATGIAVVVVVLVLIVYLVQSFV